MRFFRNSDGRILLDLSFEEFSEINATILLASPRSAFPEIVDRWRREKDRLFPAPPRLSSPPVLTGQGDYARAWPTTYPVSMMAERLECAANGDALP